MTLCIKEFDGIIEKLNAEGKPCWLVSEDDCNRTLLEAYSQRKERGNELIDFSESVWLRDVETIISTLRRVGAAAFTFSSRTTSYIDIFAELKKLNVLIQDVVYVNDYAKRKAPAILLKIN